MRAGMIRIERVFEPPVERDGVRALVDRLWPRCLYKRRAKIHLWMPEVAPSGTLRKWFKLEPARWSEFRRRYRKELRGAGAPLQLLRAMTSRGRAVSLLFAARDETRNNVVVLREALLAIASSRKRIRAKRVWPRMSVEIAVVLEAGSGRT